MSYDIKKAAERLAFRFKQDEIGNSTSFRPNRDDVAALETIFGWIDRQKKETISNNTLFAKLYIYFFNQQIRYFETDSLDMICQKELSKLLDTPLDVYYKAFHKELHSSQISKICERAKKENNSKVDVSELENLYTLDFVTAHLDNQITEALNRFS